MFAPETVTALIAAAVGTDLAILAVLALDRLHGHRGSGGSSRYRFSNTIF